MSVLPQRQRVGPCQPKIRQLQRTIRVNQHVLGLHITVDDAVLQRQIRRDQKSLILLNS